MTKEYTIAPNDGWVAITAAGESCTAWKTNDEGVDSVIVKHSNDGVPENEIGFIHLKHPESNIDQLPIPPGSIDDILYAKVVYGTETRTITVDIGGHVGQLRKTDALTGSLVSINSEHHEIHEGDHYYINGFLSIDLDDEIVFGITTPDTDTWAHVTTVINGTSQIEVYVYEDSVFTGGTPVTPINNNRNSSKTSVITLVAAPTVTELGNNISSQSSGKAGVNLQKATAGLNFRQNELLLKRNTKHIFKTKSKDDANIISYSADWYEHANT